MLDIVVVNLIGIISWLGMSNQERRSGDSFDHYVKSLVAKFLRLMHISHKRITQDTVIIDT